MNETPDSIESRLEALCAAPEPEQQSEHRETFLAEARRLRVSPPPAMRLEMMNGHLAKAERRMKTRILRRNLLLVAIVTALLVAGGVLAQEIIQFFTQTEEDIMTVEFQWTDPPVSVGATSAAAALAEVADEAEYELRAPTYIPEAYQFFSADYDAETHAATMEYRCQANDGWGIQIGQLPANETSVAAIPVQVGASAAVESVMIGDVEGQYVRGLWAPADETLERTQVVPGTAVPAPGQWTNETEWQRLVWIENGIVYSVSTGLTEGRGIAPQPCALNKDDYVAIASSLQPVSTVTALAGVFTPFPHNRQELSYQAGFDVYIPFYIPEGYIFEGASAARSYHSASIIYTCDGWQIGVGQLHVPLEDARQNPVGASAVIENVPLTDNTAQYIRGTWLLDGPAWPPSDATVEVDAEWTNETDFQQLVWYQDGTLISIHTLGYLNPRLLFAPEGCALDKDDYVAIANGLRPASTLNP